MERYLKIKGVLFLVELQIKIDLGRHVVVCNKGLTISYVHIEGSYICSARKVEKLRIHLSISKDTLILQNYNYNRVFCKRIL